MVKLQTAPLHAGTKTEGWPEGCCYRGRNSESVNLERVKFALWRLVQSKESNLNQTLQPALLLVSVSVPLSVCYHLRRWVGLTVCPWPNNVNKVLTLINLSWIHSSTIWAQSHCICCCCCVWKADMSVPALARLLTSSVQIAELMSLYIFSPLMCKNVSWQRATMRQIQTDTYLRPFDSK